MNNHTQNLKLTIALLEKQQQDEWIAIKNQICLVQENLKPLNIVKNVIDEVKETIASKNILKSLFGFGIGYLSRKIVIGETKSKFKNFVGSLLSLAITNFVNKPSKIIE